MDACPPAIPQPPQADQVAAGAAHRRRHREVLWISVAVVALSFVLSVDADRVAMWWLPQRPLPQICGARAMFNVDCPSCGLTRSFIHLAHGRLQAAWENHRVGPLLALMTVLQIPYRLLCLRRGPVLKPVLARVISYGLILALLGNWVVEMVLRLLRE
jgi:hypothetical protein